MNGWEKTGGLRCQRRPAAKVETSEVKTGLGTCSALEACL
jgi:hypothetical protein